MKIKAYHSETVESAVRQARLELGEDAVLLDSRKTTAEERHLGLYEVRFAFNGDLGTPEPGPESRGISEISRGLEEIRRLLESRAPVYYLPLGQFLSHPALAGIYQQLTANDVEPELAAQLVAALIPAAESGAGEADLAATLEQRLKAILPAAADPVWGVAEAPANRPRVIALVGPTGVGKTTTLIKIAVQFGLQQRRAVQLISTDNLRVAAIAQLEVYAGLLGVGCTAVDGAPALAAALEGLRRPELVLIDTPGYGLTEVERGSELARLLSARTDIETHLVLSASTKPRDLRLIIEKYRSFGPRRLLFTKLDETLSFGSLLNETLRTRWPVSLLGVGQKIPEDLVAANPQGLAELILGRDLRLAKGAGKAT